MQCVAKGICQIIILQHTQAPKYALIYMNIYS